MLEFVGTTVSVDDADFDVFVDEETLEVQWRFVDDHEYVRAYATSKDTLPKLVAYVLDHGAETLGILDLLHKLHWGDWVADVARSAIDRELLKLHSAGAKGFRFCADQQQE